MKKAICKNCLVKYEYDPSMSGGKFCSLRCVGQYRVKRKFKKNTYCSKAMIAYLKEIRGNKCEKCGITEWNEKDIVIQMHHINGDKMDNRFKNVLLVCPNCHTQTETWGSKNVSKDGKLRMLEGSKLGAKRLREKLLGN